MVESCLFGWINSSVLIVCMHNFHIISRSMTWLLVSPHSSFTASLWTFQYQRKVYIFLLPLRARLGGRVTQNENLAFFALFQNYHHCFEKWYTVCILKEIVWDIQKWHQNFSRPHRSWVIDQNMQIISLINNSRTARPTKIFNAIFEFFRQFFHYFSKSSDNFEIVHKTY